MDGRERLARVFVELADTLVDDFDPLDFLQTLTERSVELLGADAAGLMLADERGALQLVASTMEQARDLEVFELRSEEHTSELQSQSNLVCRLLLEKKK